MPLQTTITPGREHSDGKKLRFSTKIAVYLGNGTRQLPLITNRKPWVPWSIGVNKKGRMRRAHFAAHLRIRMLVYRLIAAIKFAEGSFYWVHRGLLYIRWNMVSGDRRLFIVTPLNTQYALLIPSDLSANADARFVCGS